jgi:hypothetical protein
MPVRSARSVGLSAAAVLVFAMALGAWMLTRGAGTQAAIPGDFDSIGSTLGSPRAERTCSRGIRVAKPIMGLELSRPPSCAIMSLCRTAQAVRWQV